MHAIFYSKIPLYALKTPRGCKLSGQILGCSPTIIEFWDAPWDAPPHLGMRHPTQIWTFVLLGCSLGMLRRNLF